MWFCTSGFFWKACNIAQTNHPRSANMVKIEPYRVRRAQLAREKGAICLGCREGPPRFFILAATVGFWSFADGS